MDRKFVVCHGLWRLGNVYLSVDISNMHNILISTTDTVCSKGQCEYPLESTCPSIYSLNETNVQHSNISMIFGVFSLHIWF